MSKRMTAMGSRKTSHMGMGEPGRLRRTIHHTFVICKVWKEADIMKNMMGY